MCHAHLPRYAVARLYGRTVARRHPTTPGRALAAPSCAVAGHVHSRRASTDEPMTPPGRAGLLPPPGARIHEVPGLSSPRVTLTARCGSRVRSAPAETGRLELSASASANRRIVGDRTGTAHSSPRLTLSRALIEITDLRPRAPSNDLGSRISTSRTARIAPGSGAVKENLMWF